MSAVHGQQRDSMSCKLAVYEEPELKLHDLEISRTPLSFKSKPKSAMQAQTQARVLQDSPALGNTQFLRDPKPSSTTTSASNSAVATKASAVTVATTKETQAFQALDTSTVVLRRPEDVPALLLESVDARREQIPSLSSFKRSKGCESPIPSRIKKRWLQYPTEVKGHITDLAYLLSLSALSTDKRHNIVGTRKQVMSGQDIVDWLVVNKYAHSRAQAVDVGQLLVIASFLHAVPSEGDFLDSSSFYYRLYSRDSLKAGPSVRQLYKGIVLQAGWLTIKTSALAKKRFCLLVKEGMQVILYFFKHELSTTPAEFIRSFKKTGFMVRYAQSKRRRSATQYGFILTSTAPNSKQVAVHCHSKYRLLVQGWVDALVRSGAKYTEPAHFDVAQIPNIYGFTVFDRSNKPICFDSFRDKVIVIVNIAATDPLANFQLLELKKLHESYAHRGLIIVAFPSDQFDTKDQETKEAVDGVIESLALPYTVMSQVQINGPDSCPLIAFLRSTLNEYSQYGLFVPANFEKFLIDRNGIPQRRYSSKCPPLDMEADITTLLNNNELPKELSPSKYKRQRTKQLSRESISPPKPSKAPIRAITNIHNDVLANAEKLQQYQRELIAEQHRQSQLAQQASTGTKYVEAMSPLKSARTTAPAPFSPIAKRMIPSLGNSNHEPVSPLASASRGTSQRSLFNGPSQSFQLHPYNTNGTSGAVSLSPRQYAPPPFQKQQATTPKRFGKQPPSHIHAPTAQSPLTRLGHVQDSTFRYQFDSPLTRASTRPVSGASQGFSDEEVLASVLNAPQRYKELQAEMDSVNASVCEEDTTTRIVHDDEDYDDDDEEEEVAKEDGANVALCSAPSDFSESEDRFMAIHDARSLLANPSSQLGVGLELYRESDRVSLSGLSPMQRLQASSSHALNVHGSSLATPLSGASRSRGARSSCESEEDAYLSSSPFVEAHSVHTPPRPSSTHSSCASAMSPLRPAQGLQPQPLSLVLDSPNLTAANISKMLDYASDEFGSSTEEEDDEEASDELETTFEQQQTQVVSPSQHCPPMVSAMSQSIIIPARSSQGQVLDQLQHESQQQSSRQPFAAHHAAQSTSLLFAPPLIPVTVTSADSAVGSFTSLATALPSADQVPDKRDSVISLHNPKSSLQTLSDHASLEPQEDTLTLAALSSTSSLSTDKHAWNTISTVSQRPHAILATEKHNTNVSLHSDAHRSKQQSSIRRPVHRYSMRRQPSFFRQGSSRATMLNKSLGSIQFQQKRQTSVQQRLGASQRRHGYGQGQGSSRSNVSLLSSSFMADVSMTQRSMVLAAANSRSTAV
eukprot:m.285211 g.285211  ORF g.285211 m.285211 type:complete len:1309 (+) comp15771_c0_seq1:556-4482(+)